MRFGSVCSGIEAASVAWGPLGWKAAWLSEIEPFPCAVLAHHYPDVPNLGDMTKLPDRIRSGEVEAPDVFCGGTPCQAFSVAGLRRSLDDERGNLSLTFCEIADAIDHVRGMRGQRPSIIFWENVPGVLNTKDNAFGCFLAGLAGEDDPLQPPGGKWTNAGVVLGPKRAVAWRTLDAQYFGLAQRRRRVFVVASAREGFDPAAVLFEFDGVRRDTPPRREARQSTAGTLAARTDGGGFPGTDESLSGYVQPVCPTLRAGGNSTGGDRPPGTDVDTADSLIPVAFGGNNQSGPIDVATARNACASASGRMDFETETFLVQPTHTLRGEGFDASEDGTGRGTPLVPAYCFDDPRRFDTKGIHGGGDHGDLSPTLESTNPKQIVAFNARQDPDCWQDRAGPLDTNGGTQAVAFSCKDYGADVGEISPTLRAMGHSESHANGGGQLAVAVALRGRDGGATAELGDDVQNCLRASSGGGDKPHVLAPAVRDISQTLTSNYGKQVDSSDTALGQNVVFPAMQVRRLTPTEAERLMGFPDGYTAIPWRGKPADQCPDSPRYKALGNSWAVPVVRWIGERINASSRSSTKGRLHD